MLLRKDKVAGHRSNRVSRFNNYLKAGVGLIEVDLANIGDHIVCAHPLDFRRGQLMIPSHEIVSLARCREYLERNPELTLLCEVKVDQEGPGFLKRYAEIRRQVGEGVRSRFVIASNSRREVLAAGQAGFPVAVFDGNDPSDPELGLIGELGANYYLPDQFRIRRAVIDKLHDMNIKVVPSVVNDFAVAEKLLGWGCDAVLTDKAVEFVTG